jgi:hypothetical protein
MGKTGRPDKPGSPGIFLLVNNSIIVSISI